MWNSWKKNTECLKLMYTLFETLFLSNEMRQKCVFKMSTHLPQYTPNDDVEQSDIRLYCC